MEEAEQGKAELEGAEERRGEVDRTEREWIQGCVHDGHHLRAVW